MYGITVEFISIGPFEKFTHIAGLQILTCVVSTLLLA